MSTAQFYLGTAVYVVTGIGVWMMMHTYLLNRIEDHQDKQDAKHAGHIKRKEGDGPWVCLCPPTPVTRFRSTLKSVLSATAKFLKWLFRDMWIFSNPAQVQTSLPENDPLWMPAPEDLDHVWIAYAQQEYLFKPHKETVKAAEQVAMDEYYRYYPSGKSKTSPKQAAPATRKPVIVPDLPD